MSPLQSECARQPCLAGIDGVATTCSTQNHAQIALQILARWTDRKNWLLTSAIGGDGHGRRVPLSVKNRLFSGAAVSAGGAAALSKLHTGCERSSIVTWVTGQRAGVSDPDRDALVQCSDCYARSDNLG